MGNYPRVLVGRGAMGAKGPYVAWLNALSSIIAVEGKLPLNIMFLAENEEIMGSPTYKQFAQQKADKLKKVNASFVPSCSQSPTGGVSMGLGLKGMTVVELTASGEAWGKGPVNTIHSMTASLVDCPPFRLAQAIATLTEPDGSGCAVKGLREVWDYRKPLTNEERELLKKIADAAEGKDWRDVIPMGGAKNVKHVRGGLEGMNPLINWLYGPTFNIAGMRSGFLGPETGTIPYIIPSSATATIDMRLVVDISSEEIISYLRDHLDSHGFSDISINVFAAFEHNITSVSEPAAQSMIKTLKQWNIDYTVWPIQGGGGPWTVIPNMFNVPCVRGGAIGGGSGRPVDEYMVIEGDGKLAGLAETEKYFVDLLYNLVETMQAAA
jgi:acetylornithine deacetylase/succinyl-diaminopimelate desuccinylase-like protein